ncbi:uncharacterized protein TNCV_4757161 [Trichonephila clavipes]|nr:uncharacterized protein TNCV_4757161 [Trichonephila clavipes]
MEGGWSARRVAHQFGLSDCVVRRCWDQWIPENHLHEDRLRTLSRDQSSRRLPRRKKFTRTANCFVSRPPGTVTPSFDPWHHDSPAVCPKHPATTCVATLLRLPGTIFQQDNACPHTAKVTRLSPHCYYPSLACLIPRFVSSRAYLGSLGRGSWAFLEFERTRGKVTGNMERNVSRHRTEQVWLIADRITLCIRTRGGSTGY